MESALPLVLLLLSSAVLVVAVFRSFNLPPVLGYLLVGAVIGPRALGWLPASETTRHLAEFGVVFLMFTIGLEFSLPRLYAMKRIVFGLGAAQLFGAIAAAMMLAQGFGIGWGAGFALGGILSMSSTAVLSRLLADRLELDSKHGREVMGVLLFQDIAVVPLLILVPALSRPAGELMETLGWATFKAAAVLIVVVFLGQRLMHGWFFVVARRKSSELFVLNVLLITLGLAWFTEQAGLSLALGAFLAGMLISETEYRYQVEEDIKPFRDVLLGLFFVTIGMMLDPATVAREWVWVLLLLTLLLVVKFALTIGISRALGSAPGTALRTGLWLCAGGEFGFVLLAQAGHEGLLAGQAQQVVLAALVMSLVLAPLIVQASDRIVLRFVASEWLVRSMQLTQIAARSMGTDKHAILCGYGRTGQHLARFLDQEGISCMALDLDPERVREAALAGESVTYGDCARRETLVAAGISRAHVLVITFSDRQAALRVLHHARELRPDLPVVVRAAEDSDVERMTAAGATEVVPEALESSAMLATHAMALLGVPMSRVVRRLREMREQHYVLLRGFFHGATDAHESLDEADQPRLRAVVLGDGAQAIGRAVVDLGLDAFGCTVSAVRRRGVRRVESTAPLSAGDVVVLLGPPAALAAAEQSLLSGR
ncbi:MAG: monovalent cation:proton antiporter-2 (CPA2) family protein [Rhodocyclaceae bacterium]|nr:monovalent cation:proton antiporter-2 (CPA2) family protein [Rhodocyclaceae bacterium]